MTVAPLINDATKVPGVGRTAGSDESAKESERGL